MPKDNIERAIAKGTGEGGEADAIESGALRGLRPGRGGGAGRGADRQPQPHRRRTSGTSSPRTAAASASPGSVAYLFDKKGTIVIDAARYSEDDLMVAVEAGAEDIVDRRGRLRGDHRSRPTSRAVRAALEEAGVEIESAEMAYRPSSLVPVERGARRAS